MRIHTEHATAKHFADALEALKERGLIAEHVSFKVLSEHRSATHARAIEVQLQASQPDRGRRAGNSGSYGGMVGAHDGYAATFDEWGWLLEEVYENHDAFMVCPHYADHADFTAKTGMTYAPDSLISYIGMYGHDPYPIVTGKGAKTNKGYVIGRMGAGRLPAADHRTGWGYVERPRTVEDVQRMYREAGGKP